MLASSFVMVSSPAFISSMIILYCLAYFSFFIFLSAASTSRVIISLLLVGGLVCGVCLYGLVAVISC